MASPSDEPTNGTHPPAEDRAPAQGADGADYPPTAPPAEGADTDSNNRDSADRGEKQVKVLIWSTIRLVSVFGLCTPCCQVFRDPYASCCELVFGKLLTERPPVMKRLGTSLGCVCYSAERLSCSGLPSRVALTSVPLAVLRPGFLCLCSVSSDWRRHCSHCHNVCDI